MTNDGTADGGRRGNPWRIVGWGLALGLILTPLIAMRFTSGMTWTTSDFIMLGVIVVGAGIGLELAVRARDRAFAMAVAIAIALPVLLFLIGGAVGIIGSDGDPANLLFLGVIGVALGGSVLAWLRPAGMAVAMTVTATAQAAVPLAASIIGYSPPAAIWAWEVIVLTIVFTALWLVSARLFAVAARRA